MGKGKAAATAPRCPVPECKNRLEGANAAQCAKCGMKVCKLHVYPVDHNCKPAGGEKKPANGGLEVVKRSTPASSTTTTAAVGAASNEKKPVELEVVSKRKAEEDFPGLPVKEKTGEAMPTLNISSAPARKEKSNSNTKVDLLENLKTSTSQLLLEELLDIARHGSFASDRAESLLLEALDLYAVTTKEDTEKTTLVLQCVRSTMSEASTLAPADGTMFYKSVETFLTNSATPSERDIKYVSARWASVVTLFGALAARSPLQEHHQAVEKLMTWACVFPSPRGRVCAARAGAEVLLWRRKDVPPPVEEPENKVLAKKLWMRCLTAAEADTPNPFAETDPMNGPSLALSGLIRGVGVVALDSYEILGEITQTLGKLSKLSSASLVVIHAFAKELRRLFEPHILKANLVHLCIVAYTKGPPTVRQGAELTATTLVGNSLGPYGISVILPPLETALKDPQWKTKEIALKLLHAMAERAKEDVSVFHNLFRRLPTMLPLVMTCVMEAKKEVEVAASSLMDGLAGVITNPETKKLMPYLLKAIKFPSTDTDKFLEELMDLTIVNSLDAQSLAILIPVVIRGLREGGTDQKKKAAIAAGNVCSLVRNVNDIRPFEPLLTPELVKLSDHSNPDVRYAAGKAKESLNKSLHLHATSAIGGGHAQLGKPVVATPFDRTLLEKQTKGVVASFSPLFKDQFSLEDGLSKSPTSGGLMEHAAANLPQGNDTLNGTTLDYISNAMVWLLQQYLAEPDVSLLSLARVEHDVENTVGALLVESFGISGGSLPVSPRLAPSNGRSPQASSSLVTSPRMNGMGVNSLTAVKRLGQMLHAHIRKVRSRSIDEMEASQDTLLMDLPNIICAFASRVLLQRTDLKLKKGHRYGLIGQNGVGKTTLLRRLAARDIAGFPKTVSSYHVEHEILSEDKDLSVFAFMTTGESDSKVLESAKLALMNVGFTADGMMSTAVGSLSGGWRMRLAIARSMIHPADLLLFDETTNHLDIESNFWLSDYICTLKATVCVVSHDYDFLGRICTDIIHIRDQKLEYFAGSFSAFQEQHPEIVEALPRPSKTIDYSTGTTPEPMESIQEQVQNLSIGNVDPTAAGAGANSADAASSFELLCGAAAEAVMKERGILPMTFPDPGKLEGITSRGKPVMKLSDVVFSYPSETGDRGRVILNGVNFALALNSRTCLVGKNGAGKSTLLKLLVGELEINEANGDKGTVWRHMNLRTSYVSQHSMHHLESEVESTPVQYIQRRFYEGRDKEVAKMITLSLTEEEKAMMEVRGEICAVLSRVKRGKSMYYEVEMAGRRKGGKRETGRPGEEKSNSDYRSLEDLEAMKKPHVIKLVRMFDEKLKAEASGMDIRPITTQEVLNHLSDFGINMEIANRKIRWMSGGQRSRLVLAAAFWSKPHIIACDEPSNFLDNDSLAVLTHALKFFKGGVVTVSHHQAFVEALCNELVFVEDGHITVRKTAKGEEVHKLRSELGHTTATAGLIGSKEKGEQEEE